MTTDEGKARVRDIGSGKPPALAVSVTATAAAAATTSLAAPAGGTGATAGAYDSAANRDLMITAQNAIRTDVAAQKVELDKLITDVQTLRAELVAMNIVKA